MPKKLTTTQRWMLDHPDDKPCPRDPNAAKAWRKKRGLDKAGQAEREKYRVAMIETALSTDPLRGR